MGQCLPVAVQLSLFFLIASLNSGPAWEFLFLYFWQVRAAAGCVPTCAASFTCFCWTAVWCTHRHPSLSLYCFCFPFSFGSYVVFASHGVIFVCCVYTDTVASFVEPCGFVLFVVFGTVFRRIYLSPNF